MNILKQYETINQEIKNYSLNNFANLIVVTKGRSLEDIQKIINLGHLHFGENRVQESIDKWGQFLKANANIKLHLIGKLQTNKVKDVIKLFSYVHSLDNDKLALKISIEENNHKKKLFHFVQVNLGQETQKRGNSTLSRRGNSEGAQEDPENLDYWSFNDDTLILHHDKIVCS